MESKAKRVFLIVMDSFGMGELPDAAAYGDVGSNTLRSVAGSPVFHAPTLTQMGLFNIEGVDDSLRPRAAASPTAAFARLTEQSKGKDTTIGHWEMAGIISPRPLPTFPDGFPPEVICEFEQLTGRKAICNKPYSGTQVIMDYGREQVETGALIVYTSADSVFQIAAHEKYIGLEELYRCCKIARGMLTGPYAVGRVIARPYIGEYPNFERTSNRHDYSLEPTGRTMLDDLQAAGKDVIGVGKINDIFAGKGVTQSFPTKGNMDGMDKTIACAQMDFSGLCFVNLVDFDTVYGHRNDIDGYARAVSECDTRLKELVDIMRPDDVLMVTADHGCDPGTPSTDHSREYVPLLVYGQKIVPQDMGTKDCFCVIADMVREFLL